jgi:hypothetical protein
MQEVEFKVEGVFKVSNIGVVVVCECITQGFRLELNGNCFINQVPLSNDLILVTHRDKEGSIRPNVYSLKLKHDSDYSKFIEGQLVSFRSIPD